MIVYGRNPSIAYIVACFMVITLLHNQYHIDPYISWAFETINTVLHKWEVISKLKIVIISCIKLIEKINKLKQIRKNSK